MASDLHSRFHETWLGMVQPIEGLVVSLPVLVDSQCMERRGPELQESFRELCPVHNAETGLELRDAPVKGRKKRETLNEQLRDGKRRYRDFVTFLEGVLGWTPDLYDAGDALPEELSRYISEGHQRIRPTLALRKLAGGAAANTPKDGVPDIETPESTAGKAYEALVWELPTGLAFDKPETETGDWRYPPAAKFDRLLRACRVPIGLLCNGDAIRLVYAPHGEATGSVTFELNDMGEVAGRPILDAFVMLISVNRFFNVSAEDALPSLLRLSRERQANVTNTLAGQVFEALDFLLRGFEAAAQRDKDANLQALLELSLGDDPETRLSEDDHIYGGLLTVLLRLVFLLYAEDRELLPTNHESYVKSLSLNQLFEDLRRDHGTFPDTMNRRYGAWPRMLALFRTIYDGVEHGEFHIPRRRGELFDPSRHPFLESWQQPDTAVAKLPMNMAEVSVPTIDDETIYRVLERLMILDGQRLSYKVLDVEQIGSVYEALMGYGVLSLASAAVCCRHKSLQSKSRGGVWIEAADVLEQKPANRSKHLVSHYDVVKGDAKKIAAELKTAKDTDAVLEALDRISLKSVHRRMIGQLCLQPGEERRRTSSHYTPRSLSEPIVRRTLMPVLVAMSDTGEPTSEQLLSLKICDPAMGSGAFLVETCRFLADHVVAAWEREDQTGKIASAKDDVLNHARRLVAQKCLYGVDKNPFAVNLAKLSLWLVTLAKDEAFSFVDHCLRQGDSLVGLSFEQLKAFHWSPSSQMEIIEQEIGSCLEESLVLRQQILGLADSSKPGATRLKEQLLWDATDAQERARIIGDLVVGAFFDHAKNKDRETERVRRLDLVRSWLADGGDPSEEILEMSERTRRRISVFHWCLEFPEVFTPTRLDPLDRDISSNGLLDAFVGNPPFLGGTGLNRSLGDGCCEWLRRTYPGANGNADLCSYFFSRADELLGEVGTLGFIATNTIGQGDTRDAGLKRLVRNGLSIYDATAALPWPGVANVIVSVVHMAKGDPLKSRIVGSHLNGSEVITINSRLRGKPERDDPVRLASNKNLAFKGVDVYGIGFAVDLDEADTISASDPICDEVLRPYIGGREVNSSPTQHYQRVVIDFGERELAACEQYESALRIVRERVLPVRLAIKGKSRSAEKIKENWWRFGRRTPTLDSNLVGLKRCLVSAQVTKHLCFSFQPTDRVFSQKLWVFPREDFSFFAVLQSRLHEAWAWLLSATMKSDLSYCASDCFDNFPFPSSVSELEDVGREVYKARAQFMVERGQGLTTTYNQLKDHTISSPQIEALRLLHLQMDRSVLAAYGWPDIEPPPYTEPATEEDSKLREAFHDEILDRLFALNAKLACEERAQGIASESGKKVKTRHKKRSSGNQVVLGISNE